MNRADSRKAIDLFSGCGGLSQGLKQGGFRVLACCEIRPEAREAYALNHSGVNVNPDVRVLRAKDLFANLNLSFGELDLLAACPPCQGFSSLRTRNKAVADDPRNELIFEVLRLVQELRPKALLIENVPRLLTDQRLLQFKEALQAEYTFSEGVLNAEDFGVPQRRKRMILIGCRLGAISLPDTLAKKMKVSDILRNLPLPDSKHKRPLHRIRQCLSPKVQRMIEMIQTDRFDLPPEMILGCHQRYPQGFRDVYGRISWDDVAPTITRSSHNPSKGRFLHPEQNRGLTVYESLLLQGFPRRYKLPLTLGIGKLSSLIGEAFPPPMAAAQAEHIHRELDRLEGTGRHSNM